MSETKQNKPAVRTAELVNFGSLKELRSWGEEIAKAGFTPLKTGSAVMAAVLAGRELGLQPMFSANNIHPINGRATLGVHAITKLLLEAGVKIEVLRDYEPCVDFVMKGEDGLAYLINAESGGEVKREADGKAPKGSVPVLLKQDFADVEPKAHEVKGKKIKNYKTVIRLTRKLKQQDGTYETVSMTGSFSTADAFVAKLLEKDNWEKYPDAMCYARALGKVANRLCGDILGGLPETTMFADVSGVKYSYSKEHEIKFEDVNAEVVQEDKPDTGNVAEEGNAATSTDNENKDSQNQ